MNKIPILFILSFFITSGFLVAYGQQNEMNDTLSKSLNNTSQPNLFEQVFSQYEKGVKFRDVIPVAIGILGFSYFIWKTSDLLGKRQVFGEKNRFTTEGKKTSLRRENISYIVKYVVIFPIILYGWVVVSFFFMYALNPSLDFAMLTLIIVGIVTAARIAAHWNEKLANDILKFLPFNLLFTLFYNLPGLGLGTIISQVGKFPLVMLELTFFIVFLSLLEGILKLIYFLVKKNHGHSKDLNSTL